MTEPLSVGLVGAGTWARMIHAPMLAQGPETTLSGVWARTPEAASAIAARYGVRQFRSFPELLDRSEAVALAVAPTVQPKYAMAAARAGKSVLLEKPIAADIESAKRLADAVLEEAVSSLVVLTYRFAPAVHSFLAGVPTVEPIGGRSWFLADSLLAGPFAGSRWRKDMGALGDVGPHAIDMMIACLGDVVDVRARATSGQAVRIDLRHRGDAESHILLSLHRSGRQSVGATILGRAGQMSVDMMDAAMEPSLFANVRREFAHLARSGESHHLDVLHGLRIQQVLHAAENDLESRS